MDDVSHLNGMDMEPMEARMQRAREAYTNAISDMFDRILDDFLLPQDKLALIEDAAQFAVFILALKAYEHQPGRPAGSPELKDVMRAYWQLEKAIKKELPGMLHQFVRRVQDGDIG